MEKHQIISLTTRKHVKIFLLSQEGISNKEIATTLGTNAGHVYNVLKNYKEHPEKAENALKIEVK